MRCSDAMISKVHTGRPDMTVEDALHMLEKKDIRGFPVVNKENQVLGIFNFSVLLSAILPVSVSLDDEFMHHKHLKLTLDYSSGQAPWLTKRLKKALPKKLEEVIAGGVLTTVNPDTPLSEGVRCLYQHGSPLPVVEKGTNLLKGIITSQSVLKILMKLKDSNVD